MEFRQVLAELMEERNVTQYRLAKQLDISQSTISSWMQGASRPHKSTLRRVADFFEVTPEYLETGIKKEPPPEEQLEWIRKFTKAPPEARRLALEILELAERRLDTQDGEASNK